MIWLNIDSSFDQVMLLDSYYFYLIKFGFDIKTVFLVVINTNTITMIETDQQMIRWLNIGGNETCNESEEKPTQRKE